MVLAVGAGVLSQSNVFVSVKIVLDAPVTTIEAKKLLRMRRCARQAGHQIGDLDHRLLPHSALFPLPRSRDPADLAHARPLILNPRRFSGQDVNGTLFDASVRLFGGAFPAVEGEKPAP